MITSFSILEGPVYSRMTEDGPVGHCDQWLVSDCGGVKRFRRFKWREDCQKALDRCEVEGAGDPTLWSDESPWEGFSRESLEERLTRW